MSAIEAELVKIFKFKKSPDDFEDHQEYLSELVLCVEKIKDEKVWDSMKEETYDWLTEAVEAKNKKNEIPDFPDAEPEEPEAVSEDEEMPLTDPNHPLHREPTPKEDGDEEDEPAEVDEETPEEEIEAEGEEGTEGEDKGGKIDEAMDEEATGRDPGEPSDEAPAKKPRKKPVKAGKYIKKTKGKPDVQPKHKPGKEPNYKAITGKKDRYGVTEGTKAALALKMFEKGCTMRDANIELGDNYYVLLRKLVGRGHRLEKLENKVLKLIHKDDISKKAKGK